MANIESDLDWLIRNGADIDDYAFCERVSLILGDDACNPKPDKLLKARLQAVKELSK